MGRVRVWMLFLLATFLSFGAVMLWRWWPYIFPDGATSELYQRYAGAEGIEASFIQGYRLNDSVRVDVTLLQATDSVTWNQLLMDSLLVGYSQDAVAVLLNHPKVWVKRVPKGYLGIPPATGDFENDYLAVDMEKHTVVIFHLDDEQEIYSINNHYLKKTKNPKTQKR